MKEDVQRFDSTPFSMREHPDPAAMSGEAAHAYGERVLQATLSAPPWERRRLGPLAQRYFQAAADARQAAADGDPLASPYGNGGFRSA